MFGEIKENEMNQSIKKHGRLDDKDEDLIREVAVITYQMVCLSS